MSISNERAIITLEVELISTVKGELDEGSGGTPTGFFEEGHDEISEIIAEEVNANIKDAIDDALAEEGIDLDDIKNMTSLVKDLDSKGIGNIKSMAKAPENFMQNTFMRALSRGGPYGALTAAIIAAIAGSPELVRIVVEAMGVKGGPLNQDYAFTQDEQQNLQFSRLVQFRRETGDNPVITVQTKGFVVGDPDFVDNSLIDIDTGRTARIDVSQSSLGYVYGI